MPTNITVCYIDDEASKENAKRFQRRLSRAGELNCELVAPPDIGDLDQIIDLSPDLFLIDYELNQVQPDGKKRNYRGTTLASEIRARFPDRPIVLITREEILNLQNPQTKRQIIDKTQPCDELIFKRDIDDNLNNIQQTLISMSQGFARLREVTDRDWDALAQTLGADDEESQLLREAIPPLKKDDWIVTGAAHWIRNVILAYPGIVYNPVHAATHLGIAVESFLDDAVQELMAQAKYDGVFNPTDGRWWKGRLFRLVKQFAIDQGMSGAQNRAFREAFRNKFSKDLTPAICIWDHTITADWVCSVLKKPVKIKNSLRYYPDNRPNVMDDARVSFRAIRESNDFDEKLLDSEGLSLVEEIRTLPDPPIPAL